MEMGFVQTLALSATDAITNELHRNSRSPLVPSLLSFFHSFPLLPDMETISRFLSGERLHSVSAPTPQLHPPSPPPHPHRTHPSAPSTPVILLVYSHTPHDVDLISFPTAKNDVQGRVSHIRCRVPDMPQGTSTESFSREGSQENREATI